MLKWLKGKEPKKGGKKRSNGRFDLDKLIEQITDVPTLPDIVFKVTEVINDPKSSAADLERTLAHDQAIVTKILKLVNSAYYRRREKIDSLGRAIPMLGFQNIRNLVFSMSLIEFSTDEIDMRAFWRHSFASSLIANEVARANNVEESDAASCAALIHDLGKVILYQFYPGEFINVITMVSEGDTPFHEAEKAIFGINHAEVGKLVCEKWGFPTTLVEPIEYHHTPREASEYPVLVAVVHLADVVSDKYGYGFLTDIENTELDKELTESLLNAKDLRERVEGKLAKEMPIFETFIDKMAAFRNKIEDHDRELYAPTDVWS
jgi:putative nucleotidyltransferase with HDIG domain